MFRILYFLIPFAVAIAIMGSRELWLSVVIPWQRGRAAGEAERLAASSAVAPRPVKRQAQG